jgi:hypothetical protein
MINFCGYLAQNYKFHDQLLWLFALFRMRGLNVLQKLGGKCIVLHRKTCEIHVVQTCLKYTPR